jgi:hypothetical protein
MKKKEVASIREKIIQQFQDSYERKKEVISIIRQNI